VKADEGGDRGAPDRARFGVLEGLLTDAAGAPRGGAPRYRLHPSIELLVDGADVFLLRPQEPPIAVRRPDPHDRALLDRLAVGPVEAPDGSDIARRLAPLADVGALVVVHDATALPAELRERFDRQLPYFADSGDAAGVQLRLRQSRVAVLGCGGLGTWALGALACAGIGHFTLVDDDVVELSNLNRQVLYGRGDIGRAKVECAAGWVRALDPDVEVRARRQRIEGPGEVAEMAADADVLVLAADWPPYELGRWVNRACVDARVPFILGGQQPPLLKVGPTFVPGRGPCFACQERRLSTEFPLYARLADQRRQSPAPATTLGPSSGVVGTLIALEVLHLLTSAEPVATEGRALLIDMRTFENRWESFERAPGCPVCGHL
jgi:molybdopterin-synthase adenylyltransferase